MNGQMDMRGCVAVRVTSPIKTVEQVILDNEAKSEARKEKIVIDVLQDNYFVARTNIPKRQVPEEVNIRYKLRVQKKKRDRKNREGDINIQRGGGRSNFGILRAI